MSHVVARIGKPHGIKGEVTVQVHTDDPAGRFVVGTVFPTRAAAGSGVPRALTLRSARDHNGIWLLAFDEVPDRTGAEGLRGTRLLLPDPTDASADASDPDEDGWYAEQLVGLPVTRPDGSALGEVSGLDLGPGQDRLLVRLPDGREAAIPFVEALVPVVDVPGRRVVVDPPPGLLEL
ncbi:MAG TPA: ribosome maturation factor RimM [Dermatophilaceae bacterium]|nr:ribosome maturation factor RimM [Dermatophilaceae bacterium]